MFKFLFPSINEHRRVSMMLLWLRIIIGAFVMYHGFIKIVHFSTKEHNFPDPLHVGTESSLELAIFAEVLCNCAFIVGFLYRLATIPIIFTMAVAYLVSYDQLALILFFLLILVYITGPGRYALDTGFAKIVRNYWKQSAK